MSVLERARDLQVEAREELEQLEAQKAQYNEQMNLKIKELRSFLRAVDPQPATSKPSKSPARSRASQRLIRATIEAIREFDKGTAFTPTQVQGRVGGSMPPLYETFKVLRGVEFVGKVGKRPGSNAEWYEVFDDHKADELLRSLNGTA